MKAAIIAKCILLMRCTSRGDESEETAFSWDYHIADDNIGKCGGLALLSQCAHLRVWIKLCDMSVSRQLEA